MNRHSHEEEPSKFYSNNVYEPFSPNVKYTCRFDIQIPNDKEFQVAKKLIGAKVHIIMNYNDFIKGCNMKRILELCTKNTNRKVQDVVKLRLRGKGSGFKEGPQQQGNSKLN